MSALLVDCLFPPAPAQLVQDVHQVGAIGCWAYFWRPAGIGGWTRAHVDALHGAGLLVPGIVVPGNAPPPPDVVLGGARALGIDPWAAVDLEEFSLPPGAWVLQFWAAARPSYRPLRYGDVAVLASYPRLDGDWLSHGAVPVRAGGYLPAPALPPGAVADQYAVRVTVSGTDYDVSVCDPTVFQLGGIHVLDPADPTVQNLLGMLNDLVADKDQNEEPRLAALIGSTNQLAASLATLQAQVAAENASQAALAAAQQALSDHLQALAAHLGAGTA